MILSWKLLFPVAILFFLSVNHFDGFEQDAILYTLQAVNRLSPERFVGDPAFLFGNQDSFSVFSVLYVLFIKLFPIDTAALLLTLLMHCGVAASFSWLVYKWTLKFHKTQLALPIALFFFSVYAYGEFRNEMWENIKTIESFPVARTFSVCFGFWGLAHLFDKNKWKSPVIFLVGFLIHPLTVGWCIPVWMLFHFPKTRLPVVVSAILFPATVLIGKVPWAAYSQDWIDVNWNMDGLDSLLQNLMLNIAFLILTSVKLVQSKTLKSFVQAETFVVGIAVYWFFMSIMTRHIFLFQVQTFRILWLSQVSIVLLQFFIASHLYITKLRKTKKLDVWNKLFFLFVIAYWIDSPFVLVVGALSFVFYLIQTKSYFSKTKVCLICLWLAVASFSVYWIVFLHRQRLPELYSSYQTFIQEFFAIAAALSLLVFLFSKKWRNTVIVIMLLCTVAVLWGNQIFPKQNFSLAYILAVATWGVFVQVRSFKSSSGKIIAFTSLIVAFLACVVINYDHRGNDQKEKEFAMNQFVKEPPFPSVENRGRILYSVKDYAGKLPRIHFLSGAYYDEQYEVGSIFFKDQKQLTEAREKKIFLGQQINDDEWDKLKWHIRKHKASEFLFEKDSLIARFKCLCQENEISHLVTDINDLPFIKEDSLDLWYKNERIYLHACERLLL